MVGNDVRSNEGAASTGLVGTVQTLLLLWEKWGVAMIRSESWYTAIPLILKESRL